MKNSHKPSITAAFLLVLPLAIFIFLSYNFSPPQQSTNKCPIKPEKLIPKNHPQLSQLHEKFHTDPIYRRRITHLLSSAIQIPTVSIDVMEGESDGRALTKLREYLQNAFPLVHKHGIARCEQIFLGLHMGRREKK